MKKSEPKLILNLQVDSEELDQKVKLAMDKYIEDVIVGNLDDEIEKIVTKRIGALVSADRWNPNRKIKDKTLDTYVKEATEKVICDVIDKNIKDIFAKKVAEMLQVKHEEKKKQNNKLSDKEKLLNDFQTVEDYMVKKTENHITQSIYREIEQRLYFNKIVSDAYTRYKDKK